MLCEKKSKAKGKTERTAWTNTWEKGDPTPWKVGSRDDDATALIGRVVARVSGDGRYNLNLREKSTSF